MHHHHFWHRMLLLESVATVFQLQPQRRLQLPQRRLEAADAGQPETAGTMVMPHRATDEQQRRMEMAVVRLATLVAAEEELGTTC